MIVAMAILTTLVGVTLGWIALEITMRAMGHSLNAPVKHLARAQPEIAGGDRWLNEENEDSSS